MALQPRRSTPKVDTGLLIVVCDEAGETKFYLDGSLQASGTFSASYTADETIDRLYVFTYLAMSILQGAAK